MFSRIQDLPRFKADLKRFNLGIDSTNGAIHDQGKMCLEKLIIAIESFDNATSMLIRQEGHSGHMDHHSAQEQVKDAKDNMESWMIQFAPNIHVDEAEFVQSSENG